MLFDVYKSFVPECFLDTTLVEVLLQSLGSVNHQKGNSTIGTLIESGRLANTFAVGLIDDDKRKLAVLKKFEKVERLCRDGLLLFRHPVKKHYIIQVSPAMERWILKECEKADINLIAFGLPDSLARFKKLKGLAQRSDNRFKRLFNEMLQHEACDEIRELQRWLEYFRDHHYNSNVDSL